ncbi:MAG TPA: hypothetical protein DCS07_07650 [Bdellovibrionales bacterium]|nr:hypothetical protein [Bdellovibrionales bacterium]
MLRQDSGHEICFALGQPARASEHFVESGLHPAQLFGDLMIVFDFIARKTEGPETFQPVRGEVPPDMTIGILTRFLVHQRIKTFRDAQGQWCGMSEAGLDHAHRLAFATG